MEDSTELQSNEPPIRYPRILLGAPLLFGAFLIFLIVSREPGQGGPTVILSFLLLVFLLTLTVAANVFLLASRLLKFFTFSPVRLLYTSVAVAAGTVFVIGLQTLGQLQLIDFILVVVFELLLNFYLLRRF